MFKRVVLRVFLNPKITRLITRSKAFRRVIKRFVAGPYMSDALFVISELNNHGLMATVDYLGESTTSWEARKRASVEYQLLLEQIASMGLDANVSLKLSQLGADNVIEIAKTAEAFNNFVRIDMEGSDMTEAVLMLYRDLVALGLPVGPVLQAGLRRTGRDLENIRDLHPRIRLCKGAYKEPSEIAFEKKREVDEHYILLASRLLIWAQRAEAIPAFATHDEWIIEQIREYAEQTGLAKDKFEFQMLYGIRRELADELVSLGFRVRIYVPYGTEAYPYFVRRLAERPANLLFLLKNLFR